MDYKETPSLIEDLGKDFNTAFAILATKHKKEKEARENHIKAPGDEEKEQIYNKLNDEYVPQANEYSRLLGVFADAINLDEENEENRAFLLKLKLELETFLKTLSENKENEGEADRGGGKRISKGNSKKVAKKPVVSQKKQNECKEILGKKMKIYKMPDSRKEYVKYKGELLHIADYKNLMKQKAIAKTKTKPKATQQKAIAKTKTKK
jgi:hypothetical protein